MDCRNIWGDDGDGTLAFTLTDLDEVGSSWSDQCDVTGLVSYEGGRKRKVYKSADWTVLRLLWLHGGECRSHLFARAGLEQLNWPRLAAHFPAAEEIPGMPLRLLNFV